MLVHRWEAILSAVEQVPGHWHMVAGADVTEDPYACIRLLDVERRGEPVKRYRAVTWASSSADRRLIGYFAALRSACEAARRRWQHEATSTSRHRDAALATNYGNAAEPRRRQAR